MRQIATVGGRRVWYLFAEDAIDALSNRDAPCSVIVFGNSPERNEAEVLIIEQLVKRIPVLCFAALGPDSAWAEEVADSAYVTLDLSGSQHPAFSDWNFDVDVLLTWSDTLDLESFEGTLLTCWFSGDRETEDLFCIDFGRSSVTAEVLVQWRETLNYLKT